MATKATNYPKASIVTKSVASAHTGLSLRQIDKAAAKGWITLDRIGRSQCMSPVDLNTLYRMRNEVAKL